MKASSKKSGTTNKGSEYEDVNIANIALELIQDPNIKSFHISSNDETFGAFDDIVLEIETEKNIETFALQLKHGDKGILPKNRLTQKKGEFSLAKYFTSFQETNNAAQKYVLFTNLKFNLPDKTQLQLEDEEFKLELVKFDSGDKLHFLHHNSCFIFRVIEEGAYANQARVDEFKDFCAKFILVTNQESLSTLKINTMKKFQELFSTGEAEFRNYLKTISQWSMQEGVKEKLNKKYIQRAIAIHVLSTRIEPIDFGPVTENMKILGEAVESFHVTVFEEEKSEAVGQIWSDALDEINGIEEVEEIRRKYTLSSTPVESLKDAEAILLSKVLWLMQKCPLIVKYESSLNKVINLCLEENFVVLVQSKEEKVEFVSIFQNLSQLKEANFDVYTKILTRFTCSLQGKEEFNLECLMNEEFCSFVQTNHLLEMLEGPWRIGGEKEVLPDPYIERLLVKNMIDVNFLEKLMEDTVSIIDCLENLEDIRSKFNHHKYIDVEDYLTQFANAKIYSQNLPKRIGSTIYFSATQCNLNTFQKICDKHKKTKKIHHFRKINENLEWIRSKGLVSDLEDYKISDSLLEEKELWLSKLNNRVNLICGDPGMGKSELMKSLKNNCLSEYWTVIVCPEDVNAFFSHPEYGNFEHFVASEMLKSLNKRDTDFFQVLTKLAKVIFVWDALDELSKENLEKLTETILEISQKNLVQWITARSHLKRILETKFHILSLSITQFDENEQTFYIKNRLNKISSSDDVEEVVTKIQSTFALVEHKNLLGIPLQIFMLTEIFRQNEIKYFDLLKQVFLLTDLYHYFVEEKFNIYYKVKAGLDLLNPQSRNIVKELKRKTLKHYEKVALKLLAPEDVLESLNMRCGRNFEIFQKSNASVGLITSGNDVEEFLHGSFGEYFAAVSFSKNLSKKESFKDLIFEEKFVNVRFFFDLLLAKESLPHIAVLYKKLDLLQDCHNLDSAIDAGGRKVSHLVSSWGQRYPFLSFQEEDGCYIIEENTRFNVKTEEETYLKVLEYAFELCNFTEPDSLFEMSPLCYAQKSESRFAEIKIRQKENLTFPDPNSAINYLYYSAIFGYDEVLDLFDSRNLPYIKTKELNHSLLHLSVNHPKFLSKVLENKNYKRNIDSKNNEEDTPLLLACENKSYEAAKILMEHGADINWVNQNGATVLFTACLYGNEEIVESLIERGSDINAVMTENATPLYIACQSGNLGVIELLMRAGAEPNIPVENGGTPLHVACLTGNEEIVRFLAANGANINLTIDDGATPLCIAAQCGNLGAVKYLASCGTAINHCVSDGSTPLITSCYFGDYEIAEFLVTVGANINLQNHEGATPLFLAVQKGHEELVAFLIINGAGINIPNKHGTSPLYMSCQMGYQKVAEILISSGAVINQVNHNEAVPLHVACYCGFRQIAELLVSKGAQINHQNKDGTTPLYAAAENGFLKIVETLVKCGAETDLATNDRYTPLHIACYNGNEEMVKFLVNSGSDLSLVESNGASPLFIAAQNGHEKIVEFLVERGADFNQSQPDGTTPLFIACQDERFKIAKFLIASGADLNSPSDEGLTPLHISCYNGNYELVEILLENFAEINPLTDSGGTPLFIACQIGDDRIVELLLTKGADPNLSKTDSATPLHISSQNGHEKIVQLLVNSDVNINLPTSDGTTALLVSSQNGHEEIVEFLISKSANVNLAMDDGTTPLLAASQEGHDKIVEVLIEAGANVNLAMTDGTTPLHAASCEGFNKIVEFLVERGADVNVAMIGGVTPLHIACESGNEEMVRFLVGAGADVNAKIDDGTTSVFRALKNGFEGIVGVLVEAGAEWEEVEEEEEEEEEEDDDDNDEEDGEDENS